MENAMRLLNRLTCYAVGHEPRYFQVRTMIKARWGRHKHARCARCDSSDSFAIHTSGYLDVFTWPLLRAEALSYDIIEWGRGKRRALARCFRKPTSCWLSSTAPASMPGSSGKPSHSRACFPLKLARSLPCNC